MYICYQRYIVNNYWLNKWKMLGDNLCTFCKTEAENIVHLFWECKEVIQFWENVKEWCANKCKVDIIACNLITKSFVFLGNIENGICLNLLVILGKVYIYRCRNDNSKLDLYVFQEFLKHYISLEYFSAKKKNKMTRHLERWSVLLTGLGL